MRSASGGIEDEKAGDFDRQEVLRKIVDRKVPHLSEMFWKKDKKARLRGQPRKTFTDLPQMIIFCAGLFTAKGEQKHNTAIVAAVSLMLTHKDTPP